MIDLAAMKMPDGALSQYVEEESPPRSDRLRGWRLGDGAGTRAAGVRAQRGGAGQARGAHREQIRKRSTDTAATATMAAAIRATATASARRITVGSAPSVRVRRSRWLSEAGARDESLDVSPFSKVLGIHEVLWPGRDPFGRAGSFTR